MPNPIPSVYFPGISLSAVNEVVFTTTSASPATFPELTNAEANPDTGDIREMAYAILVQLSSRHGFASPQPVMSTATDAVGNAAFPDYLREITVIFNIAPSGTEQLRAEP